VPLSDKDPQPADAPPRDVEALLEENKRLALELKKTRRALDSELVKAQRNRANFEAKKQFSEIVLAERSRLEQHMNLLLQNSRDFILFFDTDGTIAFCTDSFLKAIGLASFGLLKNKTLREVLSGLLPDEFIAQAESLIAGGANAEPDTGSADKPGDKPGACVQLQIQIGFGGEDNPRDYMVDIDLFKNANGENAGSLVTFYDMTDFMEARKDAERANAAKSDFLATVSHEIRTPMNAIIGLSNMLGDTELTERQREYLGKIQNSSTAMLSLINDILDFSKIEAGRLDLINEYFDFPALLESIRSLFELIMQQKGLRFNCRFATDLPNVVCADEKRIRQILTNLLNNAYKYTPDGSVELLVYPIGDGDNGGSGGGGGRCGGGSSGMRGSEGMRGSSGGGTVRFDVRDTGIGIRPEERSRLFNEFEQLDVVKNKHITGTGLGLAITKKLCELMAGSIDVCSVYGEGSTFSVMLDLKTGTEEDLPHAADFAFEFTAPQARILIVDDVEVNLEIAQYMLEPYKVITTLAFDGLDAIEKVEDGAFDLVLMDHMMPKMDGVEATRNIRQLPGPAGKIPIVALTANAISGNEEMFKGAGFDGFISKPIDATVLAKLLYKFLPQELIVD
jgi:signal transduction histidine kinase/CheY-like chemotaxis protein